MLSTFRNLINQPLKEVVIDHQNLLTKTDMEYVHNYFHRVEVRSLCIRDVEVDGGFTYFDEKGVKLTKRLETSLKKFWRETITPVTTSELRKLYNFEQIGTYLYQNKTFDKKGYYDIVTDFNWRPGTFGENTNSCFWRSRGLIREIMSNNDFYAFRLFDENQNGIARCWVKMDVHNNYLVCFNAYGRALETLATKLKELVGVEYIDYFTAYNSGEPEGEEGQFLYINQGVSYAVSPVEVSVPDRYDFNLDLTDYRSCNECGKFYKYKNGRTGNESYCSNCVSQEEEEDE